MSVLLVNKRDRIFSEMSQDVARLFGDQIRAIEAAVGVSSGIGPISSDEIEIDAAQLAGFVQASAEWLASSNNGPLRALVPGCLSIAVELYRLATGAPLAVPLSLQVLLAPDVLAAAGPLPDRETSEADRLLVSSPPRPPYGSEPADGE